MPVFGQQYQDAHLAGSHRIHLRPDEITRADFLQSHLETDASVFE